MPNMDWTRLNNLQLGRYAEYYAKMEFTSYGFEVYTSEVDDHGVDFVAKRNDRYYEVQVKSLRQGASMYTFIQKSKMDIVCPDRMICLLLFFPERLPEVYVIPATVWQSPNAMFVGRDYEKVNQKSKPEWGIQYSEKNRHLLLPHEISQCIDSLGRDTEEQNA